MDAEKRHQLKQNELAEALTKAGSMDWTDRRVLYPLLAVVAVAAVFGVVRYRAWQASSSVAQAWSAMLDVPVLNADQGDAPLASLRAIQQNAPTEVVSAMARLRLTSLLIARGNETGGMSEIDSALTELKLLTADKSVPSGIRAAAWYNTGLALESKRDFDAADKVYEQLANDPELVGSPFREIAADRRTRLGDFREPITLTPGFAPPPASMPLQLQPIDQGGTTQPAATQPAAPAADGDAAPASAPSEPPPQTP